MGRENLLFLEGKFQGKTERLFFFQQIEASVLGGLRDVVIVAVGGLKSAVIIPAEASSSDPEPQIGQFFRAPAAVVVERGVVGAGKSELGGVYARTRSVYLSGKAGLR